MKVLIVEDNNNDRKILKINIERHGCQAIEAHDGQEALEILRQQLPDLIISDALMPNMDGFELLRKINIDPKLAAIPFIFYSAVYTGKQEEELALSLGADAFVVKPVEPELFWQRLQEILSGCRLQKKVRPAAPTAQADEFHQRYGRMVAAKLEEKIKELEAEITRRKQSEQELRQAKEEWERTFNAMPEAITIHNRDYGILQHNQAAGLLLGEGYGEDQDAPCYQKLWGREEKCQGCPATRTFDDASFHQQEITQEKLQKTFLVSTTPLVNAKGEVEKIIHVANDITEQKKMAAHLRQAQKMEAIGTLAGGIAHDFNNILTSIMGYAQLAQLEIGDGDKVQQDLQQVINASIRASELVRQILTISRQSEQIRQPVEIHLILKETLKLLRPSISTTIAIQSAIEENCPPIMADPTEIHQVIMNLCTNAYHAMRDTERADHVLGIRLEPVDLDGKEALIPALHIPPGRFIKLTISDTGSGMDATTMARIFDPYFTTKEKGHGTGLGLATVHSIVTSSGGAISVESKKGEGSTFSVYFPVHEESSSYQEGLVESLVATKGNGTEHILVIDDEEPIVQLMQRILPQFGYRVTALTSGEEALRLFMEQPSAFDLIITDMNMPKMMGTDLARAFLKTRPDIPIILCTGFSEQINPEKTKNIGIRELVYKPVEITALAKLVRKILDSNKIKNK
jgi:CheY-like chemotaxis protein